MTKGQLHEISQVIGSLQAEMKLHREEQKAHHGEIKELLKEHNKRISTLESFKVLAAGAAAGAITLAVFLVSSIVNYWHQISRFIKG